MTTSGTMTVPLTSTSARETGHEHSWTTDSRHATSAGYVLYVRCTGCGAHRVDLQARADAPPAPLSKAVDGASRVPAGRD